MSFGFSGKKDDVSLKLRAQNMKNTRKQTSQLEVDSRRMEERLQELKLAMMNEKEERERNQGVYWHSGQVGKLGNYGEDIVKKTPKSHSAKSQEKKKKLKVLKGDEPSAVQIDRPKGPGTMKYIADRKVSTGKENKIKGPKCGQCEEKGAQVSCLECAEEYCAGCFAAFHMKGALKKHRSTPIGTSTSRTPRAFGSVNSTPRPPHEELSRATPTDVALIMDSSRSSARSTNSSHPDSATQNSKRLVPHPPSSSSSRSSANDRQAAAAETSLLDGVYDERQAALEFQQAIAEWRSGGKKTEEVTQGAEAREGGPHGNKKKEVVVVSPARTPVYSMDEGTGTDSILPGQSPVDIQFHGTLSYAEKLMLKKHRRYQLGGIGSEGGSGMSEAGGSSLSEYHLSDIEVINQEALDADLHESRVDVASLLGSVHTPSENSDPHRSESRISIIELDDRNMKRRSLRGVEQTSEYEVREVMENEVVPPPTPSALARIKCETLWETKQAFRTPQSSAQNTARRQPNPTKSQEKPVSARKLRQNAEPDQYSNDSSSASSSRNAVKSQKMVHSGRNLPSESMDVDDSSQTSSRAPPGGHVQNNKSRPSSVQKSHRPQSRAKSRNDRPQSRAKSRAKSRLSIFGEGNLTKEPSPALRDIAQLANQLTTQIVSNTEYRLGLGDFFTAGVEQEPDVTEPQERTLTPTKIRPASSSRPVSSRRPKSARQKEGQIEKWKISNKLYSMTPRSWKPDFSLADTVPDAQVHGHVDDASVQQMDQLAADAAQDYVTSARGGDEESAELVNAGLERLQAALDTGHSVPRKSSASHHSSSPRHSQAMTSLVKPVSRPSTAAKNRALSRPGTASNRPHSRPGTAASGRESRMIVMDGEDLSLYDGLEEVDKQGEDDNETLDQLEWELASQSGRIDGDGRISRMMDDTEDEPVATQPEYSQIKSKADHGFDIQNHLRESELMDDFEEMEAAIMEEEEVKRLY